MQNKINKSQPHTVYVIEQNGTFSSSAYNYPTIRGKCQGREATAPIEKELEKEGLIPKINEQARQNNQNQQLNQQQHLRQ